MGAELIIVSFLEMADQCAIDSSGNLLDASAINFYESESDDKPISAGSWGKLGEFLFGSSPDWFEARLSVAPKLPDCDTLVSPFFPGKLLEACDYTELASARLPKAAPRSFDKVALVNLPVETIQEIYSQIVSPADVICLSIACQFLWEIGRRQIYRRISAIVACLRVDYWWAGDRIVCIGDYLWNEDIPEGLLTAEEKSEFTGTKIEDGEDCTLSSYPDFAKPGAGFSRHIYVCKSALIALGARTEDNMPDVQYVGLGHVVLSLICLSSEASSAGMDDGNIHRGVWAGDRFDIVADEWLEAMDGDDTWTDVLIPVLTARL
ncbi:hypothetical protein B0H17DRAFT_1215555 [Mycena rosella]|uniref:F-box domain-containing protein n=1 Tax=Mycena rosella TaxID=1033263 RepID=A0AAD7FXN0_MYCRO|nr:hypothetical protein B0H17DRAFT_1215555 [Mycena rosella]